MSETTASGPGKPRIALMGEFSVGKSTLSNLLLGAKPLPEKVTATRLSPVWISKGNAVPYRIDVDGTSEVISLDDLEEVPVHETRAIRLFFESDILEVCDLIDFPGISDPNMSPDVWERMVSEVDAVLWCTHATQAWRQSEAAVWDTIPEEVRKRSLLLITRFDKLLNEKDKARVVARIKRETEGLFDGIFPISLTQALEAGEDYEKWEASGAGAFAEHLISLTETLNKTVKDRPATVFLDHPEPDAEQPSEQLPETAAQQEAPVGLTIVSSTSPEPEGQSAEWAQDAPVFKEVAVNNDGNSDMTEAAADNTDAPAADAAETATISNFVKIKPQPEAPRVMPRRVKAKSTSGGLRPPRATRPVEVPIASVEMARQDQVAAPSNTDTKDSAPMRSVFGAKAPKPDDDDDSSTYAH